MTATENAFRTAPRLTSLQIPFRERVSRSATFYKATSAT